jgi:ABC-type spermidine/putrescine transport system permease subunit I
MRSTKSSRPSLDPAAAAAPQGAAAGFRTPPPASRGRFGAGLAERAAELGGFLPAVLLFGFFFVVPLGLIIAYSFWKTADYEVVHQFTFDNYSYFFSVPAYVRTLVATLWVSALATALTLVLAFPFAYWLVRHVRPRWQKLLLALVILPFWTSYLLRIYSWLTILGEKGAINRGLEGLGIIDQPLSLLYNRPAVIVVLAYLYFPFAALTLYASLDRFDWNLLRAAMDLGASPATAFRRILLPQMKVGITTSVVFVFIPIVGEYLTPQLVGGTRGVMIGNLIVNFFQGAQYTRGAAAALLVAAVIVTLLVVFRRSLSTRSPYAG